jgi:hypothetical protein
MTRIMPDSVPVAIQRLLALARRQIAAHRERAACGPDCCVCHPRPSRGEARAAKRADAIRRTSGGNS